MPFSESGSMSREHQDDSVFTKENPFVDTKEPLKNAPLSTRKGVNIIYQPESDAQINYRQAKKLNEVDLYPSMIGVKLPVKIYSAETAKGAEEETEDEARFLAETDSYDPSEHEPLSAHGTRTIQTPPPLELFYPENYPQEDRI